MTDIKAAADAIVKGILDDAFAKYREGEKKHGVLDIDNDPRNFLEEAERELLDKIVYSCIEIARLRRINAALNALGSGVFVPVKIDAAAFDRAAFMKAVEKEVSQALTAFSPGEPEEPTL